MHDENVVVEMDDLFEINRLETSIVGNEMVFINSNFQHIVVERSLLQQDIEIVLGLWIGCIDLFVGSDIFLAADNSYNDKENTESNQKQNVEHECKIVRFKFSDRDIGAA